MFWHFPETFAIECPLKICTDSVLEKHLLTCLVGGGCLAVQVSAAALVRVQMIGMHKEANHKNVSGGVLHHVNFKVYSSTDITGMIATVRTVATPTMILH